MRRVKKMSSSSIITAVFLLCCLANGSTGSRDDCVYAATGSSLTVPLRYELKESDNLKWFKDTSVIFYRRRKQVIMGKNDAVDSTGSLKLTQLTKDKSGRYKPEVTSEDGMNVGDLQSVRLCVLDRVQKPSVTMTCTDSDSVSFTCNAGQKDNTVRFEWTSAETQLEETGEILIKRAVDVVNTPVVCRVSNPISFAISDPVIQNCFTPSSQDDCVYAATGSSLTVPLRYELKESDNLKWFKDTRIIFYRRQKQVTTGKNDAVDSTGSLKLTQLTKDKSGRYRPEVYTDGLNVGDLQSVRLCVLDRVQKPSVTMTCTDSDSVSFTCNAGQKDNTVRFEWTSAETQLEETGEILIKRAVDVVNTPVVCRVSNPISFAISDPVIQNCFTPSSQDDCVYAATGSSLTVPLRYELKESDNLKWFKDTRIIFYRRQKQVIMGKNDAVDSTGSLKLTQLTKDKSGRYRPEVYTEGINVGDLPSVRLCVLDRVQKPSVMMTCTDSDSVSFTCNAGQKDNTVRFEWTSAETQLEETGEILIKRAVDVVNTPVVCRVSNPISFAISDPVIQNCFTPSSQDDCVYAATGSSLTVPLRYELKESDNLKWFKDTSVIFYRRQKQVIMGKNDAVDSTGSLKLTQLTKDKSGRYRPEVYTDGLNVGDLQSVRLCVLDRVQKPSVTMTCIDSDSVSFTCNAGQKDNTVRFEWTSAETQLEETGEILIKRAVDVVNTPVVCRVSNPISFAISDPVIQNCFTPSSQDDCVYAATGSSLTVPLRYELKESDNLKWFKDTRIIFYRRQKQVIMGKNDVVDSTGSLKLTQLTKDKSGRYKPEVYTEGINVGDLQSVRLCVLDRVQKPSVTMTCTDSDSVSFTCNAGQKDNTVRFEWTSAETQLEETGEILIKRAVDVVNTPVVCRVSNPISFAISDPVIQNCFTPKEEELRLQIPQ
ncbi:uncharacterized protein LOC143414887 [Maylandia zebra]|uniref:uncharacterized protein LOC143414887 n=1 Tax=Maylandia zebra TaxID=106582 RepID=UPI00403CE96B